MHIASLLHRSDQRLDQPLATIQQPDFRLIWLQVPITTTVGRGFQLGSQLLDFVGRNHWIGSLTLSLRLMDGADSRLLSCSMSHYLSIRLQSSRRVIRLPSASVIDHDSACVLLQLYSLLFPIFIPCNRFTFIDSRDSTSSSAKTCAPWLLRCLSKIFCMASCCTTA